MKEIGLEELKKVQLDILLAVDEFCRNNNIEYSLAAGTLIGAVRHKGYIPWDDDVDICMTRPNYDKFIKIFNGNYNNYQVLAPELDWNYYAPYANVCDNRTILDEGANGHRGIEVGVKIDLFPIDGCTSNLQRYLHQCNMIYKYNSYLYVKRYILRKKFSKHIFINKFRIIFESYVRIQQKIHMLSVSKGFETSEFACLMAFDPVAFRAPKWIFDNYTDIEFEGFQVRTVKDYHLFLSLRYGDYMKLPSIEQRVPHHGFKAYWKK